MAAVISKEPVPESGSESTPLMSDADDVGLLPAYGDLHTAGPIDLPPSYSEAVEAGPTITQQWRMPAKDAVRAPVNGCIMMAPRTNNGVMRWVPVEFTDIKAAREEAVMRLKYTKGFYVDEAIQWLQPHKGCTPRVNMFLIYDSATGVPLFYVEEESEGCARCCLQPGHAQKQNIYIVDCYTRPVRSVGPIWSMTREGSACCCGEMKCTKVPAACGCCGMFNCADCTRDEYKMYLGYASNLPHEEQTVPMIGRMRQQGCCSGGFCANPTLALYKSYEDEEYAVVEAPKLFGGWLNFCTDADVLVSDVSALRAEGKEKGCMGYPVHTGDLAHMKKLHADDCVSCIKECCTDADRFTLDFTSETLSVEQRVSVLGSLIAMDTMLFESDMKPVQGNSNGVTCTLWQCYCGGCIIPCCIHLPRTR